ncbi:BA14K family protein [Sinorhizobium sp. RAC02]|uniref:BA14K family protein n=1 Tax=Sinorhizobium sp. RAC02 TaxID=1842534 RepID=UPI00083E1010|nr:BA14K family protein [Sinorhizobium sp. RAC02]AOF89112.1 BA14K-like family protein [Sinorhizobium sp. RAC02]
MKTTFKGGIAAAMAVAMFATTFVPAEAFAMPMPKVGASQSSDIQQVQWRERRERRGWHGGHRGYRYERHGYRRHSDGWWYPLAAFGAGAIIGGAIANDSYSRPRYEGINPRHTDWCYARYRSYRDYDNTFQPNYGGRRQCYSPYY